DVQAHGFTPASFDLAISRTGTMFFGDPVAAFAKIARSLRPGGRLSLLTWQGPAGNEWIRELSGALAAGRDLPLPPPDAPGPFARDGAAPSRPAASGRWRQAGGAGNVYGRESTKRQVSPSRCSSAARWATSTGAPSGPRIVCSASAKAWSAPRPRTLDSTTV